MTSAQYVQDARSKLGLSQIDFGKKMGVSRHTIWRYEKGEVLPERSRIVIEQLLEQSRRQMRAEKRRKKKR